MSDRDRLPTPDEFERLRGYFAELCVVSTDEQVHRVDLVDLDQFMRGRLEGLLAADRKEDDVFDL